MIMGLEVVAGILVAGLCLGAFVFSLVFALVVYPRWRRRVWARAFPITVPGWGARMSSLPPFHASPEDVKAMLDLMLFKAVEVKGYNRRQARSLLNTMLFEWLPADPGLAREDKRWTRHIRDGFGRVIAGDTQGQITRVVYNAPDRLGHTAAAHECGHILHALEHRIDYAHLDAEMWEKVVESVKEELRA